jgi:uncharacterized protein (UPF0332 family)
MAFDWLQYLNLAEQLSRGTDEASHRSAISRAYYFLYHVAYSRAVANHYRRSEDATTHMSLWLHYERNNNLECRTVAVIGQRLLQKRNRADYQDNYDRISEEMVETLRNARRCADIIEALPPQFPEDPPPRIRSF